MAEQILVPLKRHDRIEELVPYIENLARPGTKVVFLIRNSMESWQHLKDHWITTESPREAIVASQKITAKYSEKAQTEWAEETVSSIRSDLRDRGVDVAVEIYRGALRKAIKDRTTNGAHHLVIKHSNFSPAVLLHLQHLKA